MNNAVLISINTKRYGSFNVYSEQANKLEFQNERTRFNAFHDLIVEICSTYNGNNLSAKLSTRFRKLGFNITMYK